MQSLRQWSPRKNTETKAMKSIRKKKRKKTLILLPPQKIKKQSMREVLIEITMLIKRHIQSSNLEREGQTLECRFSEEISSILSFRYDHLLKFWLDVLLCLLSMNFKKRKSENNTEPILINIKKKGMQNLWSLNDLRQKIRESWKKQNADACKRKSLYATKRKQEKN